MKYVHVIFAITLVYLLTGCSGEKYEEKGFQVSVNTDNSEEEESGLNNDSLKINTKPTNVLLTGIPHVRLTSIYKVNINRNDKTTFIGSNNFYYRYQDSEEAATDKGNNWNNNLIPGLEAVYGYNMVNISHYDIKTNKQKNFFNKPVLVKTLYYPSFSKDTLNYNPIARNYFIVSVYNHDTNKDGFINIKDLRRLFLFNINGDKQKPLIPENYSVFKSEYDSDNDFMYVFAKLDSNKNGSHDTEEPIHVFWIDLKDPMRVGRQY